MSRLNLNSVDLSSEDSIDRLVNIAQESHLRDRVARAQSRALRREVHRDPLPCKPILLSAVAAPGTDLMDVMGKTWFRDARVGL